MKKKLRVSAIAMALALVFSTSTVSSLACSAVYVGKDVSADGSTIIARSEDQASGACNKMFLVVDRVENVKGRTHDDIQGFLLRPARHRERQSKSLEKYTKNTVREKAM